MTDHPQPDRDELIQQIWEFVYELLDEADAAADQPALQDAFVTAGRGYAYGGGLRVKYEGEHLQSTLSYTLSQSERRFPTRFGGRMEPVPWNEPHRLALDVDVPVTEDLTTHLSWKGIWGRTWAFRSAYYDYLSGHAAASDAFSLNDPSAHTLAPMYRLDLGLSYTRQWNGIRVEARTQLINLLDRTNAFDWRLSPTDDGFARRVRTLPGRRPVFSLTVGY